MCERGSEKQRQKDRDTQSGRVRERREAREDSKKKARGWARAE